MQTHAIEFCANDSYGEDQDLEEDSSSPIEIGMRSL